MSRLNASIKLLYLVGETFFILTSLIFALIAGLVLRGRYEAFTYESARRNALLVLLGAILMLLGSISCGCVGSIRQTKRVGVCAGRKMLGLRQVVLIGLFILCTRHTIGIDRRETSLSVVLSDPIAYPRYDAFERQISLYFNDAYFDGICSIEDDESADATDAWIMNWIYQNCPPSVTNIQEEEFCAPNRNDLLQCDTECEDSAAPNDEQEECCPSEVLCRSGEQEACPYHQCRVTVLSEVATWLRRLLLALRVVSVTAVMMVVLTCLLICYNPRDEIETELYKSGVFSQKDVETIQRLKEEKMFTFDTKDKRQSINLDQLHERVTTVQRGRAARIGAGARAKGRRHSKVSPNPSPAASNDDIT